MRRFWNALTALGLSILLSSPAYSAVVQIAVKDGGGTSRNVSVTTNTDITGNLLWNNVICDQSAGTTCASVGTAGSPSTNALTVQQVTLGNGTSANAARVTLSNDSTGTVIVTQGTAANLNATVTGTVTANAGTNLNTSALATSANQTNKSAFVQLTDGTNAAATYTSYGTAPSGNVPGANVFVTNANPNPTPLKLNGLTNSAVAIKASAGGLYMLQCGNTNASEAYVQIYNIASGSVTVGTSTPTLSIPIAATATGGFAMALPATFGTAMSAAATTTATGGSAPGTALDCNVAYE